MELNVRGLHLPVPPALDERVRHRLDLAIGRFSPRIRSVDVRLEDVNGPRGGVDKRCTIAMTLRRGAQLRAHAEAEVLGAAVDQAAHRLARQVAKRLDRQAHARVA